MLFSSITFLYVFLPAVMILYLTVPNKVRNGVLLCASLLFYGWGEPKYILLMVAAIIQLFFFGKLIERYRKTKWSKIFLTTSILCSLLMLGYFKYTDFVIGSINQIAGSDFPLLHIALPIGISFYTFQMISYAVDVYRCEVKAQKSIVKLATYVAMFPQLIAGPIVRYKSIENALENRRNNWEDIAYGCKRFLLGLGKKVLIANQMGELVSLCQSVTTQTISVSWLYGIAFTLQIYYDFSGYSDMAIGLGKMLGFTFPENFQYPLCARSVTDFWRRWHMTLGIFFRDYLYIPLGGNRVKKSRWFLNIFIVWMATGLWHGAAWNFLWWGVYFALFLIIEKTFLLKLLYRSRILSHVYTCLVVIISFIIFNGNGVLDIVDSIQGLVGIGTEGVLSATALYLWSRYAGILVLAILGATSLPKQLAELFVNRYGNCIIGQILQVLFFCLLLLIATAFLVDGSFNPFLYFRF